MGGELPAETEALLRDVEHALEARTVRLVPRLLRLARQAPRGSWAWAYAHRLLAEEAIEKDPWTASLLARRAAKAVPEDDAAWALLGLAQSLLGHYRYAASAYRRALAIAPHNPWYAHNLGHLYDVALGRCHDALRLLSRAWQLLRDEPEVVASYAHALVRAGQARRAKEIFAPVIRTSASAHHHALYNFILAEDRGRLGRRRRRKRRRTAGH